MMILSPSMLAADFGNLGKELQTIEKNGAKWIHLDVMDGIFVPNMSFAQPVIASIRPISNLFFDVHLMITEPIRYVESFKKAGADLITIHLEACEDVDATIAKIRENGCKVGISICPDTPVSDLEPYIEKVDMVLIMSVHPGFGGQKFIPTSLDKIREVKNMVDEKGLQIDIQVDGGVGVGNVEDVLKAGANVIVAGSAVFGKETAKNTRDMMEILRRYE